MRARLECMAGRLRGQRFVVEDEATVGRGIGNTIVLEDQQISTHHARIWFDGERECYLVEDLESLNGTEVDGVMLIHPERLPGLHVLSFAGELDFVFQRLPEPAGEAETTPAAEPADGAAEPIPAAPEQRSVAAAAASPILEITLPTGEPLRFRLREGEQILGRGHDTDLRLDADQLSRRHARLSVRGDRVLLADLGSSNHTFVGERRIEGEVELAPGARIRFGNLEARVLAAPD